MLSREQRIPKALAREVFIRGGSTSSPFFLLKILKSTDGDTRFAVSVSKKVAPTAVMRNRTRRRVYSAIRPLLPRVATGFLVGVSVKKGGEKRAYEDIAQEIKELLTRARILSV